MRTTLAIVAVLLVSLCFAPSVFAEDNKAPSPEEMAQLGKLFQSLQTDLDAVGTAKSVDEQVALRKKIQTTLKSIKGKVAELWSSDAGEKLQRRVDALSSNVGSIGGASLTEAPSLRPMADEAKDILSDALSLGRGQSGASPESP